MNLKKKLIFAGVGGLTIASILTVTISCSTPSKEPKSSETEEDKLLALKAENITPLIIKLFDGYSAWTAEQALNEVTKGSETMIVTLPDEITAECKITANSTNNIIEYKVIEIKKNRIIKDKANAPDLIAQLEGQVTGFGLAEKQQPLVDAITVQVVNETIVKLFSNKEQDVATAVKIATKSPLFINGVKVEFTVKEDDANKKLIYTIDKVFIGEKENAIFQATPKQNGEIKDYKFTENEYSKKLVENITAEKIRAALEEMLKEHKATTPSLALKAAKLNTQPIIIDDVSIELVTNVREDNKSLDYKISKVSRGSFELNEVSNQSDLDKLKGIIEGFKEEPTKKYENTFNEIMKTETNQKAVKEGVKNAIDLLFQVVKPDMFVEEALKYIVNRKIEITKDDETFVFEFTPTADATNYKFTYVITKLSFGFYRVTDQKTLDLFAEEITGFLTQKEANKRLVDASIGANFVATKKEIEAKLQTKLGIDNSKTPAEIKATFDGLAVDQRFVILDNGIKVEFTIDLHATIKTSLDFAITKLSKDGYDLIYGLPILNGAISHLKHPGYDAAKTLIDDKVDVANQATTQGLIQTAVGTLFTDKTQTVASATAAVVAREVTLADGVQVTFTTNAKAGDTTILEFKVTKLSKDGYDFDLAGTATQGALDAVSGEITGFRNVGYDAAKTLIDDKVDVANQATTQGLIQTAVGTLFTDKTQTVASATAAVVAREVTLADGVQVTFTTNAKAGDTTILEFKVTKLSKDGYDFDLAGTATQGALDAVSGEITGFRNVGYDAAKTLIDDKVDVANQATTQGLIQTAVGTLFTDKTQTVASATAAVVAREVTLADGVQVTFTTNAKAGDTTILEFKVTKLSKDGYDFDLAGTATQGALDAVSGEITGFRNVGYAAAKTLIDDKMDVANQATTQGLIQTALETLFTDKTQTVASATAAVVAREVTLADGVQVTFTTNAKAGDTTILEFKVTKLSKDGYDFDLAGTATQGALDAVSGEITGFRNVGYAAAKTLIDASIVGDIDATKLAIIAALETKLDAANKTAAQAKTDFDALAAGDKNVILTNNIVVELTINVNATTNTTLDFTVTKLSKDGYELTAGVNALNDSITNF